MEELEAVAEEDSPSPRETPHKCITQSKGYAFLAAASLIAAAYTNGSLTGIRIDNTVVQSCGMSDLHVNLRIS